MELDAKTQAFVDGLISKKYAEAYSKAEAKAAEQLTAVEAKHAEETNTMKAELEKLRASHGESKDRVRRALLKAEVSQLNAVNVDQVMKLVNESVIIGEDGELAVVDSEGRLQLDESGKQHTPKTFIEKFLGDNPHLKQAPLSRGAGSMSAIGFYGAGAAKTMKRGEFNKMDPAQKSNFVNSGGRLTD